MAEYHHTTSDGLELYSIESRTTLSPVLGVVTIIHGLGEHIQRYNHWVHRFNQAGYHVTGMDQRGHGRSAGQRGHTPSMDIMQEDLHQYLHQVKERFPNLPLILYGHSMGGLLTLSYLIKYPHAATMAIVTGPALKLAFRPNPLLITLGRVMRRIWPTFSQSNQLNIQAISRDTHVQQAYKDDPLVHNQLSATLGMGIIELGEDILVKEYNFKIPVLLMHGGEDHITSPAGTRTFAERHNDSVIVHIWDGLYHEIHNEPEQEAVFNFVNNWIQANLQT